MSERSLSGVVAGLLALGAVACGGAGGSGSAVTPREVTSSTACSLDGMLLADYAGPKAQVHYEGADQPEYFCDLVEMFRMYLVPEQARTVRALFVQDMGKAEWDRPRGQWIDARTARFVIGSRRHGSMGPTIASFAGEAEAQKFATEFGGRVVAFGEIRAQDAVLDGGALHDGPM